jgi:hypothetical protein
VLGWILRESNESDTATFTSSSIGVLFFIFMESLFIPILGSLNLKFGFAELLILDAKSPDFVFFPMTDTRPPDRLETSRWFGLANGPLSDLKP